MEPEDGIEPPIQLEGKALTLKGLVTKGIWWIGVIAPLGSGRVAFASTPHRGRWHWGCFKAGKFDRHTALELA